MAEHAEAMDVVADGPAGFRLNSVLSISDRLRRRMQGKACFSFTRIDEELFAELSDLTRRSVRAVSSPPFTG
jgi:hypothetical protein